jgi:hypothetical protein
MIRRGLVFLVLFTLPMFAADWQELKSEALAQRPQKRVRAMAATKTINVDCTKGDSVQDAIDKNGGDIAVEIRGVCVENVRIESRNVTLHGLSAANDGLQSPNTIPALVVQDSNSTHLENLSLSNNPGTALQMLESFVTMLNCTANNNNLTSPALGGIAIVASANSFLDATNLTMANNQRNCVQAQRGANFFCHGCDFTSNVGWAATATRNALLSLLQSTVAQRLGVRASIDAYADIDCLSEPSAHPCSMQATGRAAFAFSGAVAFLYGAGDFTGQVAADDRAVVGLYGARQLATGQPGQGPGRNAATFFGHLYANAAFDVDPHLTSRLMGTDASHFGSILITDDTEVAGTIQCSSAADAWLDETVTGTPGSSVTGCEHGSTF